MLLRSRNGTYRAHKREIWEAKKIEAEQFCMNSKENPKLEHNERQYFSASKVNLFQGIHACKREHIWRYLLKCVLDNKNEPG